MYALLLNSVKLIFSVYSEILTKQRLLWEEGTSDQECKCKSRQKIQCQIRSKHEQFLQGLQVMQPQMSSTLVLQQAEEASHWVLLPCKNTWVHRKGQKNQRHFDSAWRILLLIFKLMKCLTCGIIFLTIYPALKCMKNSMPLTQQKDI